METRDRSAPSNDPHEALRTRLVDALNGANAHLPLPEILRGIPAGMRDRRHDGARHSLWEVVEHLRITTWDILEFSRDAKHVSPEFPVGYWPPPGAISEAAWESSVAALESHLREFMDLIRDPARDLFARIDHPNAKLHHTLLREALVIVDHNGYHAGEIVLIRRLLGIWPH